MTTLITQPAPIISAQTFAAVLTAPSDGHSRTMDESFDFGLQRVLDGIELYVQSATPAAARLRQRGGVQKRQGT